MRVNDMASESSEINGAIEGIVGLAGKNEEGIGAVRERLSEFKIGA